MKWMKWTWPAMSPFANHRTCLSYAKISSAHLFNYLRACSSRDVKLIRLTVKSACFEYSGQTRYVCLLALTTSLLAAQDGASIYKERCAACHDAPAGRVPAISAIKAMSGEAIYMTMTRGSMKTQTDGLSSAELLASNWLHRAHRRFARRRSRPHANMQKRSGLHCPCKRAAMEWLEQQPDQLAIPGRFFCWTHRRRPRQTQIKMGLQPGRRH
jgi:hypothetical protein